MNVFSRLIIALNQSFRLVFSAISEGIRFVLRKIGDAIRLLSTLISRLHAFLATIIQLAINISSVLFVLFVPFGFFFDPLNWSRHLSGLLSQESIFLARIALGGFFSLVAYFLIFGLIKSWNESAAIAEGADHSKKGDFVKGIASIMSWVIILAILVYFTVFRLQLLPMDLANANLPDWLRPLLPPTASTSDRHYMDFSNLTQYLANALKPPVGSAYVPRLNARVTKFRLFSADEDWQDINRRKYKDSFVSSNTKYIYWELALDFESPGRGAPSDFKIDAVWHKADGSIKARHTHNEYIEQGSLESQHASGAGSKEGGVWTAGSYWIELFIDGKSVAKRSFEVL